MTTKNKKQFGVWMDGHHATVVGKISDEAKNFSVLAHIGNPLTDFNSSEKKADHDEIMLRHKFFKEILAHMQNAEELHLTGTGTAQEQLMHYMADTPQFKNTIATESTSNKMSDERLIEYIAAKYN